MTSRLKNDLLGTVYPHEDAIHSMKIQTYLATQQYWRERPLRTQNNNYADSSACITAIGYVVFDTICLVAGCYSLACNEATAQALGYEVASIAGDLKQAIAFIASDTSNNTQKAWAYFKIITLITDPASFGLDVINILSAA